MKPTTKAGRRLLERLRNEQPVSGFTLLDEISARMVPKIEAEAAASVRAELLPLAHDGAAMAHLNGWGILSHHSGSFKACPDDLCVRNRSILDAATEPAAEPT